MPDTTTRPTGEEVLAGPPRNRRRCARAAPRRLRLVSITARPRALRRSPSSGTELGRCHGSWPGWRGPAWPSAARPARDCSNAAVLAQNPVVRRALARVSVDRTGGAAALATKDRHSGHAARRTGWSCPGPAVVVVCGRSVCRAAPSPGRGAGTTGSRHRGSPRPWTGRHYAESRAGSPPRNGRRPRRRGSFLTPRVPRENPHFRYPPSADALRRRPAKRDVLVRIRGLRFHRGERAIFDGVDIDILRGKVTAIMGRPARQDDPAEADRGPAAAERGSIEVDGQKNPRPRDPRSLRAAQAHGMLFQSGAC